MKQGLFPENQSDKQFTLRSELSIKEKLIAELRNENEVRTSAYVCSYVANELANTIIQLCTFMLIDTWIYVAMYYTNTVHM